MKILVTGGAGYIGSVLIRYLLEKGYNIKCFDRFFFGEESLTEISTNSRLEVIRDDIRWFDPSLLDDVDAVIDLAALSNDPSGELDPEMTFDINYRGRVRVASLSKKHGVKQYLLASSCSIYGCKDELSYETTVTNPLTTYAKANFMAENEVLPLADSRFTVTALRFATVYGLSPRMRFDLALNGMTLGLFKTGKIPLMRNGKQWRPFIHVKDVVRAYSAFIESTPDVINGQIFNVGSDEQNYRLFDLAKIVGDSVKETTYDIEWYGPIDKRSYKVSFRKFHDALKYDARHYPAEASIEIYNALRAGELTDSPKTYTVNWYKHLLTENNLLKL